MGPVLGGMRGLGSYGFECQNRKIMNNYHRSWKSKINHSCTVHYATHDTRLTHGHRKLRLVDDFEILRLAPDFETLRLTCDFKTLTFQNIASDTQTLARRNISKSGIRRKISKSGVRRYFL